jgi:hypothetical protein
MGARPLARVIQEHIKKPLADEVLFGKLKIGFGALINDLGFPLAGRNGDGAIDLGAARAGAVRDHVGGRDFTAGHRCRGVADGGAVVADGHWRAGAGAHSRCAALA